MAGICSPHGRTKREYLSLELSGYGSWIGFLIKKAYINYPFQTCKGELLQDRSEG